MHGTVCTSSQEQTRSCMRNTSCLSRCTRLRLVRSDMISTIVAARSFIRQIDIRPERTLHWVWRRAPRPSHFWFEGMYGQPDLCSPAMGRLDRGTDASPRIAALDPFHVRLANHTRAACPPQHVELSQVGALRTCPCLSRSEERCRGRISPPRRPNTTLCSRGAFLVNYDVNG